VSTFSLEPGSYSIKEGANSPSLVVFLYDKFGTPSQTPLSGLDGDGIRITFVFRQSGKSDSLPADLIADGSNYTDPASPGVYQNAVEYFWQTGETADIGAGVVNFEVEIEWTEGQIEKFPNVGYFKFTITSDLRGTATAT
jgi:hypothetical protein